MDDFIIIGITAPEFFEGEAESIQQILAKDKARFIHVRKPGASLLNFEKLITKISPEFHPRLKIHDHHELIYKYNLGGVHLNSRNPILPKGANSVSKSIHSLDEIDSLSQFDYGFLSPVFDSISKTGYKAAFNLKKIPEFITGKNVIALGGVTPDKIQLLKSLGFRGGAMLGYFFPQAIN